MLVLKGFLLQPVDAREVAERLIELALSPPAGRVPDIGGPQIATLANFARARSKVDERRQSILEVPVPGKMGKAFWEGAHLAPESKYGGVAFWNVMRIYPEESLGVVVMGSTTSYDQDAIPDAIVECPRK
jgi:uncharacterized protein YbjT (DUF2867 family)